MKEQLALRKMVQSRFDDARAKNPAISLRGFSKKLGISPAALSLLLNGQRNASTKLVERICDRLLLDPQERSELLKRFPKTKTPNLKTDEVDSGYLRLSADQYQIMADWKCFAILSLIKLKSFKSDSDWIAKRLGCSETDVKSSIDRMCRLGMLSRDAKGVLTRTSSNFRTTDGTINLSLRRSHYQTLELAEKMLDSADLDHTDASWATFPVAKKAIPQAKVLIRKFQDDLIEILQEEHEPDEVYRLAMYLIPLTKLGEKK